MDQQISFSAETDGPNGQRIAGAISTAHAHRLSRHVSDHPPVTVQVTTGVVVPSTPRMHISSEGREAACMASRSRQRRLVRTFRMLSLPGDLCQPLSRAHHGTPIAKDGFGREGVDCASVTGSKVATLGKCTPRAGVGGHRFYVIDSKRPPMLRHASVRRF